MTTEDLGIIHETLWDKKESILRNNPAYPLTPEENDVINALNRLMADIYDKT